MIFVYSPNAPLPSPIRPASNCSTMPPSFLRCTPYHKHHSKYTQYLCKSLQNLIYRNYRLARSIDKIVLYIESLCVLIYRFSIFRLYLILEFSRTWKGSCIGTCPRVPVSRAHKLKQILIRVAPNCRAVWSVGVLECGLGVRKVVKFRNGQIMANYDKMRHLHWVSSL